MSANTSVNTGSTDCGPMGGMMPLCAMRTSRPTALISTVLPPVFGPETSTVNSSGARTRSKGTASGTSSGCLPPRISSAPGPIDGAKPFTSTAYRARAHRSSNAMHISHAAAIASLSGRNSSVRSRSTCRTSRCCAPSAARRALPSSITSGGSTNTVARVADSSCTMPPIRARAVLRTGIT